MKVVFMGTPEFAVAPLRQIVSGGHEVVAVYTQPDRGVGRGRVTGQSPVKRAALDLRLPVRQPHSLRSEDAVAELADLRPAVIVVCAFGQILPQAVLNIPAHGCLNIHPSLLPKYRGVSPVASAILTGDEFAGATIMLLDAGTDTGPILARAQVPIMMQDTNGSLTDGLSRIGAQLLLDVLPRWAKGDLQPRPQNEEQASYSAKISKQDGNIDWAAPATEIWRRVRAFNPWPGAYTTWLGKHLKIIEAKPATVEGESPAGLVLGLPSWEGGLAMGIGTGDGVLDVLALQLEGKRAMSAADFLRGQRGIVGSVLPS